MALPDGLGCLRKAIALGAPPYPVPSADPAAPECPLHSATHLAFPPPPSAAGPSSTSSSSSSPAPYTIPLDIPTRFESSGGAVNLRSVFFTWTNRDLPIPDYIAATQAINDQLAAAVGGTQIQNLVFVERLELVNWLQGVTDSSDLVRPLGGERRGAGAGAGPGGAAGVGVGAAGSDLARLADGGEDPQMAHIYQAERTMLDHNSVLWGTKPMDHSAARSYSQAFLSKGRDGTRPGGGPAATPAAPHPSSALVPGRKRPHHRVEPIILLSPSASSILRMSNIKHFLESGSFVPADSATAGSSSGATILHISRLVPALDPARPTRFVLVDNPDQFKPEYWARLVAVFTTGQAWQFKSYKWPNPADLFGRVMGVHVGWAGEKVPDNVVSWGRNVRSYQIDKWSAAQGDKGRWRDREVVESFWVALEESMKAKGWTKAGPGTGI